MRYGLFPVVQWYYLHFVDKLVHVALLVFPYIYMLINVSNGILLDEFNQ